MLTQGCPETASGSMLTLLSAYCIPYWYVSTGCWHMVPTLCFGSVWHTFSMT